VGVQSSLHTSESGPRTDAVDRADNASLRGAVLGGTVGCAASVPAMSTSAGLVGGVGVGQSGRAVVVAIRDAGVGGPSTDGADNASLRGAVLGVAPLAAPPVSLQ
jgi:hypothetical protein